MRLGSDAGLAAHGLGEAGIVLRRRLGGEVAPFKDDRRRIAGPARRLRTVADVRVERTRQVQLQRQNKKQNKTKQKRVQVVCVFFRFTAPILCELTRRD